MTATRSRPAGTVLGPAPGPRRIAIYLRRSTDEDHQPFSLEAQETKLRRVRRVAARRLADRRRLLRRRVRRHSTDRPELQKALRAARAGLFDTLLVYRVDRFSRSLRDLTDLLDELNDAGVFFRSATDVRHLHPGRPDAGPLLGVFAEFDARPSSTASAPAWNAKAAKGN